MLHFIDEYFILIINFNIEIIITIIALWLIANPIYVHY